MARRTDTAFAPGPRAKALTPVAGISGSRSPVSTPGLGEDPVFDFLRNFWHAFNSTGASRLELDRVPKMMILGLCWVMKNEFQSFRVVDDMYDLLKFRVFLCHSAHATVYGRLLEHSSKMICNGSWSVKILVLIVVNLDCEY